MKVGHQAVKVIGFVKSGSSGPAGYLAKEPITNPWKGRVPPSSFCQPPFPVLEASRCMWAGSEVRRGLWLLKGKPAREESLGSMVAKVFLTEPLGGGTLVHFSFGEVKMRALASREQSVNIGDRLWILPHRGKIHVLGPEGRSLSDRHGAA